MFAQHRIRQCLRLKSQKRACVTLIVYTCGGLLCVYVTAGFDRVLCRARRGKCLGGRRERGRGYSQTDVPVRTEKQKVCGLRSRTLALWACSCGLFCGLAEFKTKALSHFPCRIFFFACNLVAVASMLGIDSTLFVFLLYPESSPSCLVPSTSLCLDQIFFFYLYPVLADS